jgi:hypothetical protein
MPRTTIEDQKQSQPVRWFLLIEAVDSFNTRTGLRLANVWGLIHREEFEAARIEFQGVTARYEEWTTLSHHGPSLQAQPFR